MPGWIPRITFDNPGPALRAWRRFRSNRLGFASLIIFRGLVVLSLAAELVSNDKPLVVVYQGTTYWPLVKDYPETTFGGDFATPTDYLDPFIQQKFRSLATGRCSPNRYGPTLNYFATTPNPAPPSAANWLGAG